MVLFGVYDDWVNFRDEELSLVFLFLVLGEGVCEG